MEVSKQIQDQICDQIKYQVYDQLWVCTLLTQTQKKLLYQVQDQIRKSMLDPRVPIFDLIYDRVWDQVWDLQIGQAQARM
jgi:hypothetical protein